jgi:hypothetical protein
MTIPPNGQRPPSGRHTNSGSLAILAAMRRRSDALDLDHAKSGVRVFAYVQDQAMRPAGE